MNDTPRNGIRTILIAIAVGILIPKTSDGLGNYLIAVIAFFCLYFAIIILERRDG